MGDTVYKVRWIIHNKCILNFGPQGQYSRFQTQADHSQAMPQMQQPDFEDNVVSAPDVSSQTEHQIEINKQQSAEKQNSELEDNSIRVTGRHW